MSLHMSFVLVVSYSETIELHEHDRVFCRMKNMNKTNLASLEVP